MTCPVALYWGQNDWMAHPTDVAQLADSLPNIVASYKVGRKRLYGATIPPNYHIIGTLQHIQPSGLSMGQDS